MSRPVIGIAIGRTLAEDGRVVDAAPQQYAQAVAGAGGAPLLVPLSALDAMDDIVDVLDGALLTGGGDVSPALYGQGPHTSTYGVDPGRDEAEGALVQRALGQDIPVLGICRGLQMLNVTLGGSLHQHLPDHGGLAHDRWDDRHQTVHQVDIPGGSLLAAVTGGGRVAVNSAHHQGVDRLADGLVPVARADDDVVEAVELSGRPVLAVQWHPELILSGPSSAALFAWLVAEAAKRAAGRP